MSNARKLLVAGVALAAVAGGTASAQAQEGQVRDANTTGAVTDSYIVVLKKAGVVETLSKTLAGRYGTDVLRTYDSALHGFSVHATEREAKRLAADSNVAYVVQNHFVHVADTQQNPPSWGLDRIDQRDLPVDSSYTYNTTASNVTAYVIDTGVRATHETFGGRVSGGHDFVDNDDDPTDEQGHGTHVAGTIGGNEYGVAKGVKIVPVRVLDASGSGTFEQVIAGINWVADNASGPSVANMSLGGSADDAVDQAVQGAIAKGVTFAVAAGNSADDAGNYSPARVPEAITVAASDEKDQQADFSNFGAAVDIYAPGVNITSSWGTGDTATNTISGTSMATPHVTGAAALYLADHPDAGPAQVSDALTAAATPGKISNATAGTPNKLLYTGQ
ncbi:S8 family peptidase [Amycolatopsis pithecellobii]|uniref:S8 family serine peptidase n=1 Tax=Amycolatopsis pithecellobii TaxID=664692 RepID=A0A6N7YZV1_9PSEU|nr:S8 family peptidase [Amycolatopsis pithecellobii]MTD52790.1 S8 family serine peptidase [Amycolatopsis pithecellobii]